MGEYELFNVDCIELVELIDKAKVALRYSKRENYKIKDFKFSLVVLRTTN